MLCKQILPSVEGIYPALSKHFWMYDYEENARWMLNERSVDNNQWMVAEPSAGFAMVGGIGGVGVLAPEHGLLLVRRLFVVCGMLLQYSLHVHSAGGLPSQSP